MEDLSPNCRIFQSNTDLKRQTDHLRMLKVTKGVVSENDIYHFITTIAVSVALGLAVGRSRFDVVETESVINNHTQTFKSSYGIYQNAAVASDSGMCSEIGRDIMAIHGGNAFDAAAATALCSNVLHPQSTGIGGGVYILIYHKKHGFYAIDARETAPMAATEDLITNPKFYNRNGQNRGLNARSFVQSVHANKGPLSISVPGFLKGLLEMHTKFGCLPWKTVVSPTVKLLKEGFPMSLQTYQALVSKISHFVEHMKGFEMFLDSNNQVKSKGSIIQMPKLARTFQVIAEDPMSFYTGSLAQDIVKDIQDEGGIVQKEDLENYNILYKKPTEISLSEHMTMYSMPPSSGGPVLNHILSILSGYNMTADDMATEEARILTYHRIVEAIKFALARRTALGDEDFVDVKELVKNLSSKSYGEEMRSLIDDSRTQDVEYYGAKFYNVKDHGTSHSSILDKKGNAVSITSSLNRYFGSGIVGERTGIFFNNQIDDFSHPHLRNYSGFLPSEANFIHPGKRPMSSMCPVIVWDHNKGRVSVVTGAAGGINIPAAVIQTLLGVLWFNMSVPQSVDMPRLYHELLPNRIMAESKFPERLRLGLKQKGHHFLAPNFITVVQMIQVFEDAIVAASDYRKAGIPSGF